MASIRFMGLASSPALIGDWLLPHQSSLNNAVKSGSCVPSISKSNKRALACPQRPLVQDATTLLYLR